MLPTPTPNPNPNQVAMEYSSSKNALILRLNTSSFMERGADISFLSAFPTEKEVCTFENILRTHVKPPPRRAQF